MLHAQLAALALAATTLAVSGCGGSSKAGSTSTSTAPVHTSTAAVSTATVTTAAVAGTSGKPLSRAGLIVGAGAVCKRIDARHALIRLATQQAIVRELPLFASYQRAALLDLYKLVPPASMAHDWKVFVAAAHMLSNDTTRFGDYVKAKHFATAGKFVSVVDKDEQHISVLAKRDAITGCEQLY